MRALAHRPLFAVTAALALALGIGATSAIFGAVDAVLLRPMPFPHADRLFVPVSANPERGVTNASVTFADYEEWRREDHLFAEVALWVSGAGDLSGAGDPERVRVAAVTEEFFALIDVKPVAGRTLLPSDHVPGAPLVTVIAHSLWQRRLGGAPGAVGQHLRLDGVSREVVGVLPPRVVWPDNAALFVPIVAAEMDEDVRTRRDNMLFGGLRVSSRAWSRRRHAHVWPRSRRAWNGISRRYGRAGPTTSFPCGSTSSIPAWRGRCTASSPRWRGSGSSPV